MKLTLKIMAVLLSISFLLAGAAKLSGQEMMIESFTRFGLPLWFMYFIGAAEVAGAVGLHIQKLGKLAAIGLALIMVGAIGTHLMFDPFAAAVPGIVLLLLLVALLWGGLRTAAAQEHTATL